ncbi:MAG: DNA repair exonuclease, partial [Deltaproteobacteria bacterium]|nr:DNA repair exonuclease [Deltaproteobacteria bacterium]
MTRFLHTGDWQLGMTRHFFSEGVQERFAQSRFDAIRELGRIAKEEDCRFMVVCGDVFESNLVDRKTVSRALEALKDVPVPVYLLPGNHDPLNAASVYRSTTFLERKPAHVHVIEDTTPIRVDEGVEIVGIPWTSKRPLQDLVALTTGKLEPIVDTLRVCVAHGMVDNLSPNPDDPALISLHAAENAISQNKIHYLALGDRHSLTEVGDSGRIWYAGAPEPTDYNEVKPGFALVATINEEGVTTKEVNVGRWKFIEREQVDLNTKEDIEALRGWLENLEDKERTIVKLRLVGTLSLSFHGELE